MSVSEDTPKEAAGAPAGVATSQHVAQLSFPFLDPPHGPHELGGLGDYRVLRVLGQGGMGVVFEAQDPVLHRRLAIKVPHVAGAADAFRQRFLQEARLAASLPHDHIAAIYQVGEQRGVPFLAMEFLQGESLQARLEREHTLPVAEALRIAREVAEGLAVAHAAGLIHRDIKPANIWLDQQAPGQVKLLDFGLARPLHALDPLTEPGLTVGSPGYMSPEQVFALPLDVRTDLFSLGCVLYRMLCGKLPFAGDNTELALRTVAHGEAVPAALIAPELPDPVLVLVQELLQKNPELRPPSAQAVAERIRAIERDLSHPMPVARPAPEVPAAPPRRRLSWGMLAGALIILAAALAGIVALARRPANPDDSAAAGVTPGAGRPPLKVGVLFSTSGAMAASETPVLETTLFALDEINRAGGVRGRRVEAVVEDGHSDELVFADKAEKLIRQDGVITIFGCWTSGSRKRVAAVCAQHDNLLVYPINYEGLEESPHVIYAGGGPNQQLIPALGWAVAGHRRFFLVGSDGVYSHASNEIIKDRLKALRAECVGEAYLPIHSASGARAARIVEQIKASKADAILSTVDGLHAHIAFFRALAAAKVQPPEVPCLSFAFGEDEVRNLSKKDVVGQYAAFNYCQSLDTPANVEFLKRFRVRYPSRVVTDPMEAAYCEVHLWKQAVTQAKSDRPAAIRQAFGGQKFPGPEGLLEIDAKTRHALRVARVGRVDSQREFHLEFVSPRPMPPEPFPPSRTRSQWEAYLQGLYRSWGDHWEAPAAP